MVIRVQAMLCLTLLIVTLAEGRWHNYKTSQENRNRFTTTSSSSNNDLTDDPVLINDSGQQEQKQQQQQQQQQQQLHTELSKRVERLFRRRRYYPTASSESDYTDTTAKYNKDHQNRAALNERLDNSEEDEGEESIGQRIPRYRFTFHRAIRDRAHLFRHLHRHRQQKQQKAIRNLESNPLLDDLIARSSVGGSGGDGVNDEDYFDNVEEQQVRGKRHNRKRAWTEKDRKSFNNSRSRPLQFEASDKEVYEMEVREAQNSSLCNYTVIPIPDPGGRIPRELEHVKCNHVGSKCQDKGTYCCIQTYRNVQVLYENGREETLKIYSGCVCSLQIYGTLEPYTPDVDIDD